MKRIVNLVRSNTPALVFCDSYINIIQRLYAELSGIEYGKIKEGDLSDEEWERIDNTAPVLKDAPLYICDKIIDSAEGYIKEYEDSQLSVEYVFMDALPGNIDKDRLIQWSYSCGITLGFVNFDDTPQLKKC